MTPGPSLFVIERHVGLWFYLLSGVTATVAVGWMVRRRLLCLGTRLLILGVAVNALWELMLFRIWMRQYETVVPTLVQAVYHSATEFGPLLVFGLLLLDSVGLITLSRWRDEKATKAHRRLWISSCVLIGCWVVGATVLVVRVPNVLTTPITTIRGVDWWYFGLAIVLAVLVVGVSIRRRDWTAIVLFLGLGTFNVMFEVFGLVGGYRQYESLSAVAAVVIGLTESGTAGALVWLVATAGLWRQFEIVGPAEDGDSTLRHNRLNASRTNNE